MILFLAIIIFSILVFLLCSFIIPSLYVEFCQWKKIKNDEKITSKFAALCKEKRYLNYKFIKMNLYMLFLWTKYNSKNPWIKIDDKFHESFLKDNLTLAFLNHNDQIKRIENIICLIEKHSISKEKFKRIQMFL